MVICDNSVCWIAVDLLEKQQLGGQYFADYFEQIWFDDDIPLIQKYGWMY